MRDILKTGSFIIQTRELHKAVISVLYWQTFILIILTSIWKNTPYASIRGKRRHITKEYKQLSDKMQRILKSIKNIQDADVRLQLRDEYEKLRRERQKIESRDSMDETYRRLRYVRYADDFLIGVIGSKAECVKIKSDITKYMEENLKLELSQEKTLITNAQKAREISWLRCFSP